MSEPGHHQHAEAGDRRTLISVGMDVGSTTSHLLISRIEVSQPSRMMGVRPLVVGREALAESPVRLTAFIEGRLDPDPLQAIIADTYAQAGIEPSDVDTGAVIATGEAARQENARAVIELLSGVAGSFVCVAAGHHLEARLAAYGSGSVRMSREGQTCLLNLDVGGGTTKLAVVDRGSIVATGALQLGARLVELDEGDRVRRVRPPLDRVAAEIGVQLRPGTPLPEYAQDALATHMAACVRGALPGCPDLPLALPWLTEPVAMPAGLDGVVCSGGVAEYVYGRTSERFGDLGLALGRALRSMLLSLGIPLLPPGEAIRATVAGASQFTLRLSGSTIYRPDERALPLRNLAVVKVPLPASIEADTVVAAVRRSLARADPETTAQPFALFFSCPPFRGYSVAEPLAAGIAAAFGQAAALHRPAVLAFSENLGQVVGQSVERRLGWAPVCVDEVDLDELDYVDVGLPVPGESYLPLMVKTLVFPNGHNEPVQDED